MTQDLITTGTAVAAVAAGLVAGVMLAFSTSVMPTLRRRPAAEGIAAMQTMNAAILNPLFGALFGGSALLCAALAITAPFTTDESHAVWRGVGAAFYIAGTFGLTIGVNVPMNEALDEADPASGATAELWRRYLRRWTAWNNLRTLAGTAASALLIVSLL
jgi:uncharacterized membrane protein